MKKIKIDERVFVASICDSHMDVIKEFNTGAELDHFCTASNMDGEKREEGFGEIQKILDLSPKGVILHAPFNELYPAAIDPLARDLAMKRLSDAAGIAKGLGAVKMVVHSGYVPNIYFKQWHVERSVEFWNEFVERNDIDIVIENVLEDEPYMMAEMMESLTDERIRLCLDTGHALCMSRVPVTEWVDVMAPYLGHIHIHSNDGSWDYHEPPGTGILDMEKVLDKALSACKDLTVTVEAIDALSSMKWLKEKGYI